MNPAHLSRLSAKLLTAALLVGAAFAAHAQTPVIAGSRVLYETGFEQFEGFNTELDLADQGGWVGFSADLDGNSVALGGSGLLPSVPGFFGQVAYIGFNAPAATADFNVWRPVNFAPGGEVLPIVQFTVSFQIEASSAELTPDAFRWSVYNVDGRRLFSLDFDNASGEISAILDDATPTTAPPLRPTGFLFPNGEPLDLELVMNFQRNLWTAKINGAVVVNALKLTTRNSALTLGDVDAVWLIREPGNPGDNYMIFDDYRLVTTPLTEIPPTLEIIGFVQPSGAFIVRVLGEPGVTYELQATSDFDTWLAVGQAEAQSPDGSWTFRTPAPPVPGRGSTGL